MLTTQLGATCMQKTILLHGVNAVAALRQVVATVDGDIVIGFPALKRALRGLGANANAIQEHRELCDPGVAATHTNRAETVHGTVAVDASCDEGDLHGSATGENTSRDSRLALAFTGEPVQEHLAIDASVRERKPGRIQGLNRDLCARQAASSYAGLDMFVKDLLGVDEGNSGSVLRKITLGEIEADEVGEIFGEPGELPPVLGPAANAKTISPYGSDNSLWRTSHKTSNLTLCVSTGAKKFENHSVVYLFSHGATVPLYSQMRKED